MATVVFFMFIFPKILYWIWPEEKKIKGRDSFSNGYFIFGDERDLQRPDYDSYEDYNSEDCYYENGPDW